MVPFVRGQNKWPFPQIEKPSWGGLVEPFRRASVALKNCTYERLACALRSGNSELDLLVPPLFDCECAIVWE